MNNELRDVVFSGIVAVRDRLMTVENAIRLESGEPSFDTPSHIKEAMTKAMTDNHTHYGPSTGVKPLKSAIMKKVTEQNGIDYLGGLDKIFVTNGGMHALYCTMQTILNSGDEVIVPKPNWTATTWMIRLSGGKDVGVKLKPELAYRWDFEDLKSAITPKTKAVLINSPHNPTGGIMTKADMEALLDLAEKHDLYIVSDEAYEHIIYDETHYSIAAVAKDRPAKVRDKIITCFTFSKSYAMTGWRLGYIACNSQDYADNMKKMILYTINGVSTPSQYAGIAALEGPQDNVIAMRDTYRKRRDLLFDGVNSTDLLKCDSPPKGAFYLYAKITDKWSGSAWDLVNYLIDNYDMGSVPGDVFYDDQKSIRFSYACSTEMIERAIVSLKTPKKPVSA